MMGLSRDRATVEGLELAEDWGSAQLNSHAQMFPSLEGEDAAMPKSLKLLLSCRQPRSIHKSDGTPGCLQSTGSW